MFLVTTAQLTKAVTGVDYESGPHQTKRKRKTGADHTTPSKVLKHLLMPLHQPHVKIVQNSLLMRRKRTL